MLALHRLFASSPSEGGLGLECSDSFFFYQNGSPYPHYSYFEGVSTNVSPAGPVIRELVSQGYLDTCHGLGDFEYGGFARSWTKRACAEFKKHNLGISVWSNHGGYSNWQNIGKREFVTYHSGDDFNSQYYHLDLLYELGCRYFWTDVSLAKKIGLKPTGKIATESERRPAKIKWVWPLRIIKPHILEWTFDKDEVFDTFRTRGGATLQEFVRYDNFFPDSDSQIPEEMLLKPNGIRAGPNIGRIANTLTTRLLDKLVESAGCCFLYQHFSTLAHIPQRTHISAKLEFHPDNLTALRLLNAYSDEGKIWVVAQRILLDYIYMRNTVDVFLERVAPQKRTYRAHVRKGYEFRSIAGLTWQLREYDPDETTKVEIIDPDGRVHDCSVVGPDEQGVFWVQVPLRRLPKIDWVALAKEAKINLSNEIQVEMLDGNVPVDLNLPSRLDSPYRPN